LNPGTGAGTIPVIAVDELNKADESMNGKAKIRNSLVLITQLLKDSDTYYPHQY
jgi:hypothetical protein